MRKHNKGQIAIFVVLIFQVLFILFAMTINVAMTVYDKINLQNSLDLAAYYGAKQQAEVLNAMAHINYQMRQNWKLLSWRYRILGTLTQDEGYPAIQGDCTAPKRMANYWCPQNKNCKTQCNRRHINPQSLGNMTTQEKQKIIRQCRQTTYPEKYCDKNYFICISAIPWIRGVKSNKSQNVCKIEGFKVPAIPDASIPGGPIVVAGPANMSLQTLRREVNQSCPMEGALNALTAHMFLILFREDQLDRRRMIQDVFNKTLKVGKDLDGIKISDGVNKVFWYNLSKNNRKNIVPSANPSQPPQAILKSETYNSIEKGASRTFNDFFEEIQVRPVLQILDFYGSTSVSTCPTFVRVHYDHTKPTEGKKIDFEGILNRLGGHLLHDFLNTNRNSLEPRINSNIYPIYFNPNNKLLIGYYKKNEDNSPKIYYGLHKNFEYSPRIFNPLPQGTTITFRASSIAKPFGGVFGPKRPDPLIQQISNQGIQNVSDINPYKYQPNYSRYPGDEWGLVAKDLHDPQNDKSFLNKLSQMSKNGRNHIRAYSIDAFFHAFSNKSHRRRPLAMDPLAYSETIYQTPSKSFMRMMELMAIYPDLFDIVHYSIAGNYMDTFFQRICKLLKTNREECKPNDLNKATGVLGDGARIRGGRGDKNYYIRGDFGWPTNLRISEKNATVMDGAALSIAPLFLQKNPFGSNRDKTKIEKTKIEKPTDLIDPNNPPSQIRENVSVVGPGLKYPGPLGLTQGNLFYPWLAKLPEDILSSWAPPIPPRGGPLMDYKEYKHRSTDRLFLNCLSKVKRKEHANPSGCSAGGRSGYSVKLISCEVAGNYPDFSSFVGC